MVKYSLNKKLPYYAIALSITLCSIMGVWWLYLLAKLGNALQEIGSTNLPSNNLYKMIIAEGSTFFILLILVLISIFLLVKNDKSKMFALQRFYAIFSHELKTPLTTLQLQLEVLPELLNSTTIDRERLDKTLLRLNSSSEQLKNEVHKMLTLSQLELGQKITLHSLDLKKFLQHWIESKSSHRVKIELIADQGLSSLVMANPQALDTILNNLLNNTERHVPHCNIVKLTLNNLDAKHFELTYSDQGKIKTKNTKLLGTLFYKDDLSGGSGLGLYIIAQMMKSMKGVANFYVQDEKLLTTLVFKKG